MKIMNLCCLVEQSAVYFLLVKLRAIKISNEKPFLFKLEPLSFYEEDSIIKKLHLKNKENVAKKK